MVHFEEDKDFLQAPAELWAKLSDCRFLVECIPGLVSVKQSEPTAAKCLLQPGFSFARATLEIDLTRIEAVPETQLQYLVRGKGIGSSSEVTARLTLAPHETGTRVHWSVDVTQLGGLLKAIPPGLIHASALRVVNDTWEAVKAKLGATP